MFQNPSVKVNRLSRHPSAVLWFTKLVIASPSSNEPNELPLLHPLVDFGLDNYS
jgi:hypothetical protein